MTAPACAGHDPETWTAHRAPGESPTTHALRVADAKAICATCPEPVRVACIAGAYTEADAITIRGGLTPDERAALARRRNKETK